MSELFHEQLAEMPEGARTAYDEVQQSFEDTITELVRGYFGKERDRAVLAIQRIIAGAAVRGYSLGVRDGSATQTAWQTYPADENDHHPGEPDPVEHMDPLIELTYTVMGRPLPALDSQEYKDLKEDIAMLRESPSSSHDFSYGVREGGDIEKEAVR
jgi:hypothetical protein